MPVRPLADRSVRCPAALPILLSIVFLLMMPGSPLADPSDEVGGDASAQDGAGPSFDLGDLHTELGLSAGYRILSEADMYDTYGGLPLFGVDLGVLFDDRTRFVMGVAYGTDSGDPYYDRPDFESGQPLELKTVPVHVGFRIDASENPRFGLHLGVGVEMAWIEELVPDPTFDGTYLSKSGWAKGMRLSLTPEWRSADRRRSVGLSFEFGGVSGEIGSGHDTHEVNLIGYGARLHAAWAL